MTDKKPHEKPAFFKGEFSFVNKDAKNIDSKDHNAAVSWHVMNRYERWKKQEQAKKLRASANVPIGPMSTPGPAQSVRRLTSSGSAYVPLTNDPHQAAVPDPPFGFDPWMADQPLQAGYPRASPTPVPLAGSSTVALPTRTSTPSTHSSILDDPFASMWTTSTTSLDLNAAAESSDPTSTSNTSLASVLVSFAYGYLIANSWPAEPGSVMGSYEIARSWDDIEAINQDQCYSNAYLALLAVAMAETNDADDNLIIQARKFQAQAMSELKRRVARNQSQDLFTLKAILKLFSAETIIDNTAVARVHLKMLRSLVIAAGGVILLDTWFREDLLSCDCYFALKYGTRPTLPAQEWTPGPLSAPWKARLVSAGIVGDHAATVDPALDHAFIKAVVTDLRELFKVNEYALNHDVPTDDQLLRWRQFRKFDCVSRLGDHLTNLTIYPHLYDKAKTQTLITVAIALLTNMVLGCPEPVRFGLKLLSELKERWHDSQSEASGDEVKLRLWVAYVGSLAEKVHPVERDEAKFFAKTMKTIVRNLRVEDWEAMKQILRRFLFSESLQREIETGCEFRKVDTRKGLFTSSGTSWREPVPLQTGALLVTEETKGPGKQKADDG